VGQNPNSLSSVWSAGMDCSQHSPARIKPHRGQVREDLVKAAVSEGRRVFHEHEARSHFAHDSAHFAPQAASVSIEPEASAGNADILARETASDDIHQSMPRPTVKSSDVGPNRESWEASVILPSHEDGAGIFIDFDCTDGAPAEEFAAEYAASSACE
jgi:hypothetical protein